jgi:hypothetical protein
VRHFEVSLYDNGSLRWTSRTVSEPPGHRQISSARYSGTEFSMSIGIDHDPQSDAFNGITEQLISAGMITIAGAGSGVLVGDQITGTFRGDFTFFSTDGQGNVVNGSYCTAADHTFVLSPTPHMWMVTGVVLDAASSQAIPKATVEWSGLAEGWGDRGHGVTTDNLGHYRMGVSSLGGPGA